MAVGDGFIYHVYDLVYCLHELKNLVPLLKIDNFGPAPIRVKANIHSIVTAGPAKLRMEMLLLCAISCQIPELLTKISRHLGWAAE